MSALLCRLRGHRWQARSHSCARCGRTALEIRAAARKPPTWDDVDSAYWRGVEAGRDLADVDRQAALALVDTLLEECRR